MLGPAGKASGSASTRRDLLQGQILSQGRDFRFVGALNTRRPPQGIELQLSPKLKLPCPEAPCIMSPGLANFNFGQPCPEWESASVGHLTRV